MQKSSPFFSCNSGRQSRFAVLEQVGAVEEDTDTDGRHEEEVVLVYTGHGYDRVVDGSEPAVVDIQVAVEEDTEVVQDDEEPYLVAVEDISHSKKVTWWAICRVSKNHTKQGC